MSGPSGDPPTSRFRNDWAGEDMPDAVHDERYWPGYTALAVVMVLQLALPSTLGPIGQQVVVSIDLVLLAVLVVARSLGRRQRDDRWLGPLRHLTIVVIATATLGNLIALGLLVHHLVSGSVVEGSELISAALSIWATNVVVFSLWYWELDGSGPVHRRWRPSGERDFWFPQLDLPAERLRLRPWQPSFFDYLYLSFTNSTAFSPTDTLPLTPAAKALMMVQSGGALLTVALVAARAVNILQ